MVSEPSRSAMANDSSPALSSSSIASSSSSTISLPISFNISHHFNTLMDRHNFFCWRSQFEDILDLHDLKDVVSIKSTTPPKKLEDGSLNPTYSKGKLVLSWIKPTTSPSIQKLLLSCSTTYEAWHLLEKRLSPLSKIHIRTLRDQLRTLKRDADKPIADFLLHAKPIADSQLSLQRDHPSQILNLSIISTMLLVANTRKFSHRSIFAPPILLTTSMISPFKRNIFLNGWHLCLYQMEQPLLLVALPKMNSPIPISRTKISIKKVIEVVGGVMEKGAKAIML
ncbi:hypothetical protein Vadar_011329 [Vaccinium darrowii]|uniref:Uncharacterized protein n=1 Tax=Vaccinium darrowii TaxID=229202 RepID=A0ACB7YDF2_9ERIC|nr:hypothetical protein Vadar_011329 [Vaccinium darrowii]